METIRDPAEEARETWVGAPPTPLQITAFLVVGSVGLITAGVQPVLLGALVAERRLSAAGLGWATTIEFLTLGLGVSLAGVLFRPTHLRLRIATLSLLTLIVDLAARGQHDLVIQADRAVAGVLEGGLVWATMLMIARSPTPARWAAVFLVTQGVAQLAFAAGVPATLMKTYGPDGGFYALAATCAVSALAAALLPDRLQDLVTAKRDDVRPALPSAALVSLGGVALIYAFFIGLYAYITQLGGQSGLNEAQSGYAVALAVGVSILGSGAAALVAKRVRYFTALLVCMPIFIVVLLVFLRLPSRATFLFDASVFGFFWGFFMPYQLPFVIESDPSRRAALLVPGVQSVGAAAGPLVCSFFVTDADARGALWVCGACLCGSFAVAALVRAYHYIRRRPAMPLNAGYASPPSQDL